MRAVRLPSTWLMVFAALLISGTASGVATAQKSVGVDGAIDADGPIGATKERRALAAIKKLGGKVSTSRTPVGRRVGDPKGDLRVYSKVELHGRNVTDAELRHLDELKGVMSSRSPARG